MAGALDSLFKNVAKSLVSELGQALDTQITYTVHLNTSYDVTTGALTQFEIPYEDIYVPIEFVVSEEEEGREQRQAKLYISPDLIGGNQPTMRDEVTFTYAGTTCTAQITDIRTYRGGQEYLYILLVRF